MRFKPAPETYRYVAKELDAEVSDFCMVACHFWDTIGAQAAGCAAALVRRPGNAQMLVPSEPTPNIVVNDMHQLATDHSKMVQEFDGVIGF